MVARRSKLTYEERKERALGGTRAEYLCCPMCGFNRSLGMYESGEKRFGIDLENTELIQVRHGGGFGIGFHKAEGEGMTLRDMKQSGRYDNILANILSESKRIVVFLSSI